MRYNVIKVQFVCEGTYLKHEELTHCFREMEIEDIQSRIEHRYRQAGWGYIDEYGIRHLCNASHIEEMHDASASL